MKLAVTGHRPDKLGNDYKLESPLIQWIKTEIEAIIKRVQPELMISGMALGIDTLFAKLAVSNDIPLIAAVPFSGQEAKWPKESRELYSELLEWEKTTIYVVSQGGYAGWKMQVRNEWMVNNSDFLIAVWDGSEGGTCNCVMYAKRKKRNMVVINPVKRTIEWFFYKENDKNPEQVANQFIHSPADDIDAGINIGGF